MVLNYGNGENVWMHPPVHRILGWYSRPSNFDLKRNVWRLNQITQIIDNEIYVKGDPAISDLATLNRFPTLIEANLININGSKIGVIADFLFEMKTGKIKYYLVSRSNPKIPGSSRWKLNIANINDQQPGLVFCQINSLNNLSLIKSSIKNELMEEESITLELENLPWYIELAGSKNEWDLRFVFESQDQTRSFEMYWPIPIAQNLFYEIKNMWESMD